MSAAASGSGQRGAGSGGREGGDAAARCPLPAASDWAARLRTALAIGLAPDAFWALSVREWGMLTASAGAAEAMGRSEFERLAEAYG